jgi:uncharacterized protein YdhG (YjbR/CyaY superfamily)
VKSDATNVDAYLEELEPGRLDALVTLRSMTREAAPDAGESMQYGMPTYSYKGHVFCAFASQKNYISLYMDTEIVEQHGDEVAALKPGKSCIRFRNLEQLPLDTIETMLKETVAKLDAI